MLMLVKKGGKAAKMPTAEELVGLPPPIEGTSEIVGEADEGETAMAGIEVGEGQMQSQKMLEQVSEMVTKEPEAVARMLNRWVVVEE
jgi:flagellar biosynthesis/type III secretory pathway M-ring protein FliF/YscJ